MFKVSLSTAHPAPLLGRWPLSLLALAALTFAIQSDAQLAAVTPFEVPSALDTSVAPEANEPAAEATAPEAAGAEVAAAEPEAGLESAIESVVVTARRVAESRQEVPIPIATLSGKDLEAEGSFRIESLNQKLPSTNIQYANPRQSSFSLRGFGNNPANDALETDVGTYLDNVYLARPGMANFDLVDIDQVYLLRGPQGTLFGKNTTAGVLNISTRQPSFTPEGTVETSVGSDDFRQLRISYAGPLIDQTLAGRITLTQTDQDGFINNVYDGRELNGFSREGVRGQLLYLKDTLSVRLIGDYQRENSACCIGVLYSGGLDNGVKYFQQVEAAGGANFYDPDLRKVSINDRQAVDVHQAGLSAEVNTELGEYKLTSISAWRSWYFKPTNDGDFSSAPAITRAGQQVDDWQASQELRIASPTGGAIDYVAGLFYFYQGQDNNLFTQYGPAADVFLSRPAGLLSNVFSNIATELTTSSISIFGQGTWHLNERLGLTAGLRETYEKKSTEIEREAPIGGNAGTAIAFGPYQSGKLKTDDDNLSGLLSLDYKLGEQVLLFTSLGFGAKSGGINPAIPPSVNGVLDTDLLFIKPQKTTDVELGIKTTLLDRRLVFNANLFWAHVKDYQAATLLFDAGSGQVRQFISNVGSVESQGIETDIEFVPVPGISLSLAASYNEATYKNYKNGPCAPEKLAVDPTLKSCDLSGERVLGAPDWIINPGVRVERELSQGLKAYGIANYSWRSEFNISGDNSKFADVDGYGIANLRIGLRGGAGAAAWDFSVFANNAFDEEYVQFGIGQSHYGVYPAFPGQPRLVGVTLRVNF